MNTLIWILLATIIDSLVGFVGIFSLWIKHVQLKKITGYLVSFSAGALLGGAFFHLLAEAVETAPAFNVMGFALTGFILFLLMLLIMHYRSHVKRSNTVCLHSLLYAVQVLG